jgi:hypothetical protein
MIGTGAAGEIAAGVMIDPQDVTTIEIEIIKITLLKKNQHTPGNKRFQVITVCKHTNKVVKATWAFHQKPWHLMQPKKLRSR